MIFNFRNYKSFNFEMTKIIFNVVLIGVACIMSTFSFQFFFFFFRIENFYTLLFFILYQLIVLINGIFTADEDNHRYCFRFTWLEPEKFNSIYWRNRTCASILKKSISICEQPLLTSGNNNNNNIHFFYWMIFEYVYFK